MPPVRSSYTDDLRFFGGNTPQQLVAAYGSPLYVYNENILRTRCREMLKLSTHPGFRVNYSAKANSNPALLRIIREEGCFSDAMSPGELYMNLRAGFLRDQILYVCNNVSEEELKNAAGLGLLVSVDSLAQLDLYGRVDAGGKVMLRFNPGIGAGHHQKVVTAGASTKFGFAPEDIGEARALLARYKLTLAGLNQHIGSLFMTPDGYLEAMDRLLAFAAAMTPNEFSQLEVLDFGGGFGIPYHKYEDEARLDMKSLARGVHGRIISFAARTGYRGCFYLEPGRYIAAECGLLLGTVHAVKTQAGRRYVGTDIGFNALMRPVLYDSHHDLEIYRSGDADAEPGAAAPLRQTVVGNICESGDILAENRELPEIRIGDILGVLDAGAYGFSMCSNYNLRLRPAEVLINADGSCSMIRRRDSLDDLIRNVDV